MSTNLLSPRGRFALACAFLITFGSPLAARHDHTAASPAAPEAAQAPAKAELAPEAPAASGCCAMAAAAPAAKTEGGHDCCAKCAHCSAPGATSCCSLHDSKAEAGQAHGAHGAHAGHAGHEAHAGHAGHAGHGAGHPQPGDAKAEGAGCCGESCTAGCCGEAGCNAPGEGKAAAFSCPMHPEITATEAGVKCSECGMKLVAAAGRPADGKNPQ